VCTFCTYMTQIYIYVVWYLTFYIACFFSVDMRQWCMSMTCSNGACQWHAPLSCMSMKCSNGGSMSIHPCCMSMSCSSMVYVNAMQQWWDACPCTLAACQCHTAMVYVNDIQQWCMSMTCSNGACQCHAAMVHVNAIQQWCMSMTCSNGACQCHTPLSCMLMSCSSMVHVNVAS